MLITVADALNGNCMLLLGWLLDTLQIKINRTTVRRTKFITFFKKIVKVIIFRTIDHEIILDYERTHVTLI